LGGGKPRRAKKGKKVIGNVREEDKGSIRRTKAIPTSMLSEESDNTFCRAKCAGKVLRENQWHRKRRSRERKRTEEFWKGFEAIKRGGCSGGLQRKENHLNSPH